MHFAVGCFSISGEFSFLLGIILIIQTDASSKQWQRAVGRECYSAITRLSGLLSDLEKPRITAWLGFLGSCVARHLGKAPDSGD